MQIDKNERGHMPRKTLIVNEEKALDHIKDGMTIALGGFITAQHPMAVIRGLVRRNVKDLTVIGSISSALDVDLLVGAGCVRRLVTAYVGAEAAAPLGPFCKQAAEAGSVDIWESDEIIVAAMLHATAQGIPFFPVRGGLGTDLPRLNPELVEFRDPIRNEPLLAVPSMPIDVALTHAAYADEYGNVQYVGNVYFDELISKAAEFTVTTVEKIVPPEFIRKDPFKTAYTANAVVRAPYGAHPYSCHGFYPEDDRHLQDYAAAAYMATQGDGSAWIEFKRRYLDDAPDHMAYLEQVGLRRLLSLSEF
ncbi:MAG: CoA transferase subunit A [Deltaproteobacteria bacterium]|nr:CoA transferase subunit A [Deltaproteobacteria bacterium]